MLTTTYATLLTNLGMDAGKVGADLTTPDRVLLTYFLNEAVKWAWKDRLLRIAHPDTVTSGQLVVTAGHVAASLIQESTDWATVWTKDPRNDKSARRVEHELDGSGIWITESSPPPTVYVFWRLPVPVYSTETPETGTLPSSLERAVRYFARWKWLASKDLSTNAAGAYKAADDTMSDIIFKVSPLPFWLQDGNQY
jgi:hypothetical protein